MRVVDPGHLYVVDTFGSDHLVSGWRRFFKLIGPGYPGNEPPGYAGTNCQEELRVLIDRTKYLDGQQPNERNRAILDGLRTALWEFEMRAAERRNDVDRFRDRAYAWAIDNHQLWTDGRPDEVELIPACPTCGHVLCVQHRRKA